MTKHICPADICEKFAGDEEQKMGARSEAFNWLTKQSVKAGDEVHMPDGDTGELRMFIASHDIRVGA